MKDSKIRQVVTAAMFAAICCVLTMTVRVPTFGTNGYVNIGDMSVLLGAWLLGGMYGALAGGIGSAMAGVAGVLLCSAYPTLSPYTGAMPGIKAFVAAVFGGIGSIPGAMIGGLLLGIIEILAKSYISSQLSDAIVFSVLIIVLLVKPTGIMGKVIQEKV